VRQRANVIDVDLTRHLVSAALHLLAEASLLFLCIVQFGERVPKFHARDVNLEALHQRRIIVAAFRQRRNIRRKIVKQRRLN